MILFKEEIMSEDSLSIANGYGGLFASIDFTTLDL
jgi:hypothetical protein